MNKGISLVALGHATSLFLAITFTFCVAFDYFFPEQAMFGTWQKLLPGFDGINIKSYFIGLIQTYGYGWYIALIWAPLYNFFCARSYAKINKNLTGE